MGAGLVGDHVRAHAAFYHFRHDVCGVAAQRDRDGAAFGGIFLDAGQGIIQRRRLLVNVAGTQAEIDTALLALNVQRAGARQGRGQRLRTAHSAQAGGEYPAAFQAALVVLAAGFDEGFVGALHDALAADINPASGGHLAIHGQAFGVEFVEVLPGRPVRDQVRVGDQHAG
ncbi:hypothetical protein D3C80_185100 [compost metagenome]